VIHLLAATVANPAQPLQVWPRWRALQAGLSVIRSAMPSAYIGNNVGSIVHYSLLGHWTATVMNGPATVVGGA
jgi:hypothetical protein